jgi:hypothetical protein
VDAVEAVEHPAVEQEIARDIARHALLVAPVVVLVVGLAHSGEGAASAAIGLGLVIGNFLLAAALQAWAARISPAAVAGAAMFGYVLRLAVLLVAVLGLREISWIDVTVLVLTVAFAHLALLVWELKSIRLSFTEPGLRVTRTLPPSTPRSES